MSTTTNRCSVCDKEVGAYCPAHPHVAVAPIATDPPASAATIREFVIYTWPGAMSAPVYGFLDWLFVGMSHGHPVAYMLVDGSSSRFRTHTIHTFVIGQYFDPSHKRYLGPVCMAGTTLHVFVEED